MTRAGEPRALLEERSASVRCSSLSLGATENCVNSVGCSVNVLWCRLNLRCPPGTIQRKTKS